MSVINSFSKNLDILQRSMDASLIRHSVIADNLANAGVPGFKRSEVNFESELKRALASEGKKPRLELRREHPLHVTGYHPRDYRDVQPRRVLDYLTATKNNGSNVDAEQEAMKLVNNQLKYNLMAQAMAFEFNQVSMVLR